jgi:hypothetical protein
MPPLTRNRLLTGHTPASCQHKASVSLEENGECLLVVSGVETVEQRAVGQVTCLAGCNATDGLDHRAELT